MNITIMEGYKYINMCKNAFVCVIQATDFHQIF